MIFDDTAQSLSNLNRDNMTNDQSRQLSQVFKKGLNPMECQSMAGASTVNTKRYASVRGGVAISEMTRHHMETTSNAMRAFSVSKSQHGGTRHGGSQYQQQRRRKKRTAPTIAESMRNKE